MNSWLKYSPPRLDQSILILLPLYFSTSDLNFLNLSSTLDLGFIKYTWPYLLWSSMNIMKYEKPPMAWIFIGPHTSECISLRHSFDCSPFPVKGDLSFCHVGMTHIAQSIPNRISPSSHHYVTWSNDYYLYDLIDNAIGMSL